MTHPNFRQILIIEDDLDIRESIAELLELEGYKTEAAANGKLALEKLRGESQSLRPDLILLDLTMPVMDGPTFRREQLADPKLSQIPVVVLSADGQIQEKARDLAPQGVIRKPIELEPFLSMIRTYFPE